MPLASHESCFRRHCNRGDLINKSTKVHELIPQALHIKTKPQIGNVSHQSIIATTLYAAPFEIKISFCGNVSWQAFQTRAHFENWLMSQSIEVVLSFVVRKESYFELVFTCEVTNTAITAIVFFAKTLSV